MDNGIYIYCHVYMINNWDEILKDIINSLRKFGLLEKARMKIGAVFNGNENLEDKLKDILKEESNIEIAFVRPNGGYGESETMSLMKDECSSMEECYVLYLHAKGVTHHLTEREAPVKSWRKMMEYFLIENWEKCIEKLVNGYDCCGINYQKHVGNIEGKLQSINIFNGNYFWAQSDYIKKLNTKKLFEHRYSPENWICSLEHKAWSFYNSPININLYYECNNEYKQHVL